MPSPFPGMDPYLEKASIWPDLHQRLITYTSEALQPQIRPKYIARIGERVQLAAAPQSYIPDVLLVHPIREAPTRTYTTSVSADEPQKVAYLDEERHVPFVEIVYRESGEVVTIIEVLSPTNKVGDGREQYLQKQQDLLNTQVNLVEIDLLGYGKDTALARNVVIIEPTNWRYVVNISRAERRRELELYAIPLQQRLPRCRIPLRPTDADAVLDLPAVFTRCYDVGGYDLLIDYSHLPDTPMQDEEKAWLVNLLQEKGLRSPVT